MVRNIAGSLMAIGLEDKPVTWMQELLLGRNRNLSAATAPADGLYFVSARYPDQYRLPQAGIDFPAGEVR
jgi:tRNA pseudouridine38-40 synthase